MYSRDACASAWAWLIIRHGLNLYVEFHPYLTIAGLMRLALCIHVNTSDQLVLSGGESQPSFRCCEMYCGSYVK